MAITTAIKGALNRTLSAANLRMETLTRDREEAKRVESLERRGYFDKSAFPLLAQFKNLNLNRIIAAYDAHKLALQRLGTSGDLEVGYDPANVFFSTPDAEALYLIVQITKPRKWVEVGSGNSTRLLRRAIRDGSIDTLVTSIDPEPRVDVVGMVDTLHRCRLEDYEGDAFSTMHAGDILFIDSSHFARTGNDVVRIFMNILPALPAGVIVHIHDVFLPYEYPLEWVKEGYDWNEQYLLQCFLHGSNHDVLWPGYHLQRDRNDMADRLPFLKHGRAQSLWLRTG